MSDWARVMVPLSGGEGDARALAAGAVVAEAFKAELAGVHTPADIADLIPWMGEGFMGGVQATAVLSLREASAAGEKAARATVEACPYASKVFLTLASPVRAALAMESRLADMVVFDAEAARGRGPLAEAFQQMVAEEQRPTLVAHEGLAVGGVVAVAWDGGKEATRAVRTAMPLLRKASAVVILSAPAACDRVFDPEALRGFLAARGVPSRVEVLPEHSDAAPALVRAAKAASASVLVAGAFGHSRLREWVFGGATRTFLGAEGISLWLSH
jgi:nucleotide-binding universal stress UspA family protein